MKCCMQFHQYLIKGIRSDMALLSHCCEGLELLVAMTRRMATAVLTFRHLYNILNRRNNVRDETDHTRHTHTLVHSDKSTLVNVTLFIIYIIYYVVYELIVKYLSTIFI